jgi:hypothetical protein
MIRFVHRILDFAAAAGSVAVTAHPAAALAHLGHPRPPRPTRARRRSTPQPGPRRHAPERLTWLEWAGGAGSRRVSAIDATVEAFSGLDPSTGSSSRERHAARESDRGTASGGGVEAAGAVP